MRFFSPRIGAGLISFLHLNSTLSSHSHLSNDTVGTTPEPLQLEVLQGLHVAGIMPGGSGPDPPPLIPSDYSFGDWLGDVMLGSIYFFHPRFWMAYWADFLIVLAYYITAYCMIKFQSRTIKTKSQLSSIIPLVQSTMTVTLTFPLYPTLMTVYIIWGEVGFASVMLSTDRLCGFVVVLYMVGLLMDILIGVIDYRDQLKILPGYMHHVLLFAVAGNALLHNFGNAFSIILLQELTTVIKASGRMFPRYKSELTYGITCFCLRIIFHTMLTVMCMLYTYRYSLIWILGMIMFAFNIYALSNWSISFSKMNVDFDHMMQEDETAGKLFKIYGDCSFTSTRVPSFDQQGKGQVNVNDKGEDGTDAVDRESGGTSGAASVAMGEGKPQISRQQSRRSRRSDKSEESKPSDESRVGDVGEPTVDDLLVEANV